MSSNSNNFPSQYDIDPSKGFFGSTPHAPPNSTDYSKRQATPWQNRTIEENKELQASRAKLAQITALVIGLGAALGLSLTRKGGKNPRKSRKSRKHK